MRFLGFPSTLLASGDIISQHGPVTFTVSGNVAWAALHALQMNSLLESLLGHLNDGVARRGKKEEEEEKKNKKRRTVGACGGRTWHEHACFEITNTPILFFFLFILFGVEERKYESQIPGPKFCACMGRKVWLLQRLALSQLGFIDSIFDISLFFLKFICFFFQKLKNKQTHFLEFWVFFASQFLKPEKKEKKHLLDFWPFSGLKILALAIKSRQNLVVRCSLDEIKISGDNF